VQKQLEELQYSTLDDWYWGQGSKATKEMQDALKNIGIGHPISILVTKYIDCRDGVWLWGTQLRESLISINDLLFPENTRPAKIELAAIYHKYPLLAVHGLHNLWKEHADAWQQYVRLIDNAV
jgi:hypothetical protein